ncbi:unnamed protein product [Auanema sp. JU1783]|nr:unnamed protein product [Auanema sp. JU1783]
MNCSPKKHKDEDRCLRGQIHLNTGMKLLVTIGTFVIIALVTLMYFKFRKAMFILLIPTFITVSTVFGIISKRQRLLWPIIGVSMFHAILACYALLIFSFYFFFKPYYIIMVLNWAFNTLHTEKTPSYYMQCACIYLGLFVFLFFNIWQAVVSFSYRNLLIRERAPSRQPTVLVVNKPGIY